VAKPCINDTLYLLHFFLILTKIFLLIISFWLKVIHKIFFYCFLFFSMSIFKISLILEKIITFTTYKYYLFLCWVGMLTVVNLPYCCCRLLMLVDSLITITSSKTILYTPKRDCNMTLSKYVNFDSFEPISLEWN